MKPYKVPPQSGWRVFRWPIALALATTIGLGAALFGDGFYDVVSWIALGSTPIAMTMAWFGWSAD